MNYATERDSLRREASSHPEDPAPTQNRVLQQLVYDEIVDFLDAHWTDLCNIRLNSKADGTELDEDIERGTDALVDAWIAR